MSNLENIELTFRNEIIILNFSTLDHQTVNELISIVRTVKQTNAEKVILNLSSKIIVPELQGYNERLNWSKQGQVLTSLISSSSIPFVTVLRDCVSGELAELASSCSFILALSSGRLDFNEGNIYIPRWGVLDRINDVLSSFDVKKIYTSYSDKIWFEFINKLNIIQTAEESLEDDLKSLTIENILFRLSSYHLSKKLGSKESLNYLESTNYVSSFEGNYFKSINYLPINQLESSLMIGKISENLDDFGNDFMNIDAYPNLEEKVLKRKNRIEEVTKIVNDKSLDIKGKCIELGSGYGYFSMILSKKSSVTEAVAFDISVAETNRFGPFIKELIQPNMDKITYKVGDFNKLSDEYGQYDTVIFCASLHHSSDIPKSLEIANKLLKKGGKVILHGEHYRPRFLGPKKKNRKGVPKTIPEFCQVLRTADFQPRVYRYALSGKRLYALKKFLFEQYPFKYINGWFKVANYLMYGIKQ